MSHSPNLSTAKTIDFRVRVPPALCPAIEVPKENAEQYQAVLDTGTSFTASRTLEDLLTQMDNSGIDHAVMHAEYEVGDVADALNQTVAEIVQQHPDRFTGIGTVSMENFRIATALKQIDACVEMGMIGLSIEPAFFGMEIGDRRLYPLYAKAMENQLLVALHTGINYTSHRPMSGEHPMQIDALCCDFPELTVVASHGAWPWAAEMVAVARKHPKVYMEFGGLAPKYIGEQGSGWEVMHRFMNTVLSDQILYATDWPVMSHQRTLSEWQGLGLKPAVAEKLLSGNAQKIIG